jgi:signal transduction histidine kinase/CheY-like chemotaxis protein
MGQLDGCQPAVPGDIAMSKTRLPGDPESSARRSRPSTGSRITLAPPPEGNGRPSDRPRDSVEILTGQLAMVDRFAKNVAHEMNNVLAAIVGLASVIESELEPGSPLLQDASDIITASKRGLRLTKNLLLFARQDQLKKERLSVNDLVSMVRSLLLRSVPPESDVEVRLAPNLDEIDADPIQLKQALVNIGINALEALDGPGKVTLSTDNVHLDGLRPDQADLAPGDYVRIQIADTGRGMGEETLGKAAEPFFTTKPPGVASGLGLPLSCATLHRHNGGISLFSKKGLGTTVAVYLPVVKEQPAKRKEQAVRGDSPDALTIMVVDDDQLVLRGARRLLQTQGYRVLPMPGGAEAIKTYEERGHEVDLVLLDLVMPDKDGLEVLKALKKLNPNVEVVIASGYPMDNLDQEAQRLGVRAVVTKPYTAADLNEVLQSVLP